MFDLKLFLGFLSDEAFSKAIKKANPYLLSLFIGKEEYLQTISCQGKEYLGKFVPHYASCEQLEDLERHLLSLLSRLAPGYPFAAHPPVVLTLSDGN